MSNYWLNNMQSKDDINTNRSIQQNFGVNSTGRLNSTNGFTSSLNNNTGAGSRIGSTLPRQLNKDHIDNIYQNGTFGIEKFEKHSFMEKTPHGLDAKLHMTLISMSDNFFGFELDELRYIDWKIKNNKAGKFQNTPQFNRVNNISNNDNFTRNYNISRGLNNFSVSKTSMGNLINSNNSINGNNDFNSYLRPDSTYGVNANKTFPSNNPLHNNSANNAGALISNFNVNSNLGASNPISNNAFNKNQFTTNLTSSNYLNNLGTPSNAISNNANKSFANYYDNTNKQVFPVNNSFNPVADSSGFNNLNNNMKNFQSTNFSGTNYTTNSFNTHIKPDAMPAKSIIPLGSSNNMAAFNTNNNFMNSTNNNLNFGISPGGNFTPQNKFNMPPNQTMPVNNYLTNNQSNSSVAFTTGTKFNQPIMSSNNNFNFSTPSQNSINILPGGNSNINTNTNYLNHPQNIQFGISKNTFGSNQPSFGFGNNQETLNFKSSAYSRNNITFNNSYFTNTNVNQANSLNLIKEIFEKTNSNDDYLGIKSLCQEVNSNLNKFSKKEIEQLFDLSFKDENSSKYLNGMSERNNILTSSRLNKDFSESTFKDNKSCRISSLNDNLPYKNSFITFANFRNNKENSCSDFSSKIRTQLRSVNKPVDRNILTEEIRERSSSKDSAFRFNETASGHPFVTAKKTLTIDDILPLNINKLTKDANLLERVDKLEEKANNELNIFETNMKLEKIKADTEMYKKNPQKSAEYRNEILKLAEETHRKYVGGPFSFNSENKHSNLIPIDNKNVFPSGKIFSSERKVFSNIKSNNNKLQSFLKSNKNMNTINESRDETDYSPVDINTLDDSDKLIKKKEEKKSNYKLDGVFNLKFKISSPVTCEFSVNINKKNKITDLRDGIQELLIEKYPTDLPNLLPKDIIIFSKNGILKDDDVIETKSFVNENELLFVFISTDFQLQKDDLQSRFSNNENIINVQSFDEEDAQSMTNDLEIFLNNPIENAREKELRDIVRPDYCPFTKKYKTIPSYADLIKMPKEKLENLRNFTLYNNHGKISWLQSIDVTYLNFDEIVNISNLFIEVYPDMKTPKYGEKLNNNARLHIKNVFCPNEALESDSEYARFILGIKKDLEKNNAQYIDYNIETSELIFDVKSFDKKECT